MKRTILGLLLALAVFLPSYVLIPVDFVSAASINCECVLFLREALGVNIHGDAWTIQSNIPMNQIEPGDVLLFSYEKTDHVALVLDVIQANAQRPDIYVTIQESNFHHCIPDTRTISLDDPAIRGLYRPPLSTPLVSLGL